MHITVESLHEGEHLPLTAMNARVYVNGKKIEYVIEAETEEGWVLVYKQPLEVVEDCDGEFATETIYGQVEITLDGEVYEP